MSNPEDSGYESCLDTDPFDWPQIMPNIVPEQTRKKTFKIYCEQICQFCLDILAIFCLIVTQDQLTLYSNYYKFL